MIRIVEQVGTDSAVVVLLQRRVLLEETGRGSMVDTPKGQRGQHRLGQKSEVSAHAAVGPLESTTASRRRLEGLGSVVGVI